MEQVEEKVNVEETTINLGCVKRELEEGGFEFDENHYKLALTFENIFGQSSSEVRDNRDTLIGFFDDEVIMEMATIKLEDVKEEEDLIRDIMERTDFQIVQCWCCKVWLEKHEHLENHMLHCVENYNRFCRNRNLPDDFATNNDEGEEKDEITTSIDVDASYSIPSTEVIDSDNCVFLKVHKEEYFHDNKNMGTIHSNTNEKTHKCSECSYQTNYKGSLKSHLVSHTGVKDFQCDICKRRFGLKSHLQRHIKDKHSNTNEKEYKCSECSYQTNRTYDLKIHLSTHTKQLQCDICNKRFGHKSHLKVHIKNKHSHTNEKDYKCSECLYQTNNKSHLKRHLGRHTDVKNFVCDICKQTFGQKGTLRLHIKDKHSNTNEKEYKCSECSYQTNHKGSLNRHLGIHSDIKRFQCDICKQTFGHKTHLKVHLKNQHSNTNEKEYKCSECFYQTNYKANLKIHLATHTDVKNFRCDICKHRFGQKSYLRKHIKNKHSNTNEKR